MIIDDRYFVLIRFLWLLPLWLISIDRYYYNDPVTIPHIPFLTDIWLFVIVLLVFDSEDWPYCIHWPIDDDDDD